MEAVSFGDTTCEVCVLAAGIYKDFIIDIGMIQHQLQRFGDVSQMSIQQMEEIAAQRMPLNIKLTAIGMSVQAIELKSTEKICFLRTESDSSSHYCLLVLLCYMFIWFEQNFILVSYCSLPFILFHLV